jgi:hypothetical protein
MIPDLVHLSSINFIWIANDHIISFFNLKPGDPKIPLKSKQMFNMKNVYRLTESNGFGHKTFWW